ncbi:MAG: hypothetical protein NTY38_17320 [Acidobacteria bacterium]|nr:hypothetical protein [Acidobacteriota bacterium]
MSLQEGNPFSVQTPEDIKAAEVVDLFVDVFGDFYNIPNQGHTFLHGPRGSGKSMMFRYLEPDCQLLASQKRHLSDLPFYAVYIPIKNTDLKLTELERLENKHANVVLNEHFLTVFIASRVFASLRDRASIDDPNGDHARALGTYVAGPLRKLLYKAGLTKTPQALPGETLLANVQWCIELFDELCSGVISYLRRLSFRRTALTYNGPLCGYLDFLLPMLKELRALPFMPQGPIYLLLDDADNLNETQTRILNSWVFCRTSYDVSLKISTQLNYKTFRTATNQRIDSPHDYTEIDISTVYTSSKSHYSGRVEEIVRRRLKRHGLTETPKQFFPEYEKQEEAIRRIEEEYIAKWKDQGRGHRPRDDAYRYARPDFITSLSGAKKGASKYRYAGFEQLVYLSSGVIRYFLEPASRMYAEALSTSNGRPITRIDSLIQDRIIRDEAEKFMVAEFEKLSEEETEPRHAGRFLQLRNLIHALGGAFHEILISDKSERRVFSIAFSDPPDRDVLDVLKLGVQYGYIHEASIGNKEGTGRTRMFVLSRRLAPFFMLDPTGFAGYKFVTNAAIKEAILRPKAFIANFSKGELLEDPPQLRLFDGETMDDAEDDNEES